MQIEGIQSVKSRMNGIASRFGGSPADFALKNLPPKAGEFLKKTVAASPKKDASIEPKHLMLTPAMLKHSGQISSSRFHPSDDIKKEVSADPQLKELYDSARDFQSIFINMMLKSMRSTLNKKDDLFYGGQKQDIFEDMLYDEYAKVMSRQDTFDLGDQIYRQLSPALKGAIPPGSFDKDGTLTAQESSELMKRAQKSYEKNLVPAQISTSQTPAFKR